MKKDTKDPVERSVDALSEITCSYIAGMTSEDMKQIREMAAVLKTIVELRTALKGGDTETVGRTGVVELPEVRKSETP